MLPFDQGVKVALDSESKAVMALPEGRFRGFYMLLAKAVCFTFFMNKEELESHHII
tara:strand:- start:346 stop:513 length:168 start_codon:yes stop_codon:yes gene_type:complete